MSMVYELYLDTNTTCYYEYTMIIFVLSTPSIELSSVNTYYWISCLLGQTWGYNNCCLDVPPAFASTFAISA